MTSPASDANPFLKRRKSERDRMCHTREQTDFSAAGWVRATRQSFPIAFLRVTMFWGEKGVGIRFAPWLMP